MSRTYASVPVLSKIKIGESYYYLKDSDARAILDSINDEAYVALQAGMGTVEGNDGKLVTAANIKAYVDSAVSVGLVIEVVQVLPTASADTMGKLYLVRDEHATGDIYDEFITIRSGDGQKEPYAYSWEKIGNTDIDLSGYVTDVKFENGVLKQQKGNGEYANVHEFGAMADADTASGTVNDYVTGVQSAKVTAEGSISGGLVKDSAAGVEITGTVSKPDITVTPTSATIEVIDSVGTLPSKQADSFTANTPTQLDLSKFNAGSKAADSFTAPSLGTGFVTAGSAAQFTEGAFTPASLTTQTKALYKQGIKAEVGTGADAETLIFSNVDKEADIKVVDTFNGGSKAADSFVANTPTAVDVTKFNAGSFTEGAFTAPSLGAGFYTVGSAASFEEGAFSQGTLPTKKDQSVLGSVSAELESAPVFSGDKYAFSGAFEGSEVDANVTLSKGNKTIVVNPDAGE